MTAHPACDSLRFVASVDDCLCNAPSRPPQRNGIQREILFVPLVVPTILTSVCQPSDSVLFRHFKQAAEKSLR